MPAASNGQSYPTTALVTAIQARNPNPTLGDATPLPGYGTITVDNRSPGNATWGAVSTASASVTLNWTNPADADLNQVIVLRKPGGPVTDVPLEGTTYGLNAIIGASTVVYAGTGTTSGALTVTNGTSYYFKIFAKDGCGNYSPGVQVGPIVTTTTGTAGVEGDTARGSLKPTVSIINPAKGAVVAGTPGTFKVQVRVFSPNGAPVTGVALNSDGTTTVPGTPIATFSRNPNFDGVATDRGVWDATVTLPTTQTSYTLRARATKSMVIAEVGLVECGLPNALSRSSAMWRSS